MSALDGVPVCTHETLPEAACRVVEAQAEIYYAQYQECAHSAILLPGFNTMPQWFLAVVYGLALAWCFFGVAIISDIFMEAIEQITSAEKVVRRPGRDGKLRTITVLVWNPTVANLTLMALGSSAPEIMLAVLEAALTLGRAPGELGPSTIVGSAAFNLLVISAVCIMSVPEGQVRAIADFPVFLCTTAFSLWAYLWMLIVYKFWTPDEVTLLEALLTLAYLPLMVTLAYVINARPWVPKLASDAEEEASSDGGAAHKEAKATAGLDAGYRIVGADYETEDGQQVHIRGSDIAGVAGASSAEMASIVARRSSDMQRTLSLDERRVAKVLNGVHADDLGAMQNVAMDLVNSRAAHTQRPMTAIQYKINARKAVTGRAHVGSSAPSIFASGSVSPDPSAMQPAVATVQFAANAYTCAEHQGHIKLQVLCTRLPGHEAAEVRVRYATRDGTAIGGDEPVRGCDFERAAGELIFPPQEGAAEIVVRIYEDDLVETEEEFFVDLAPAPGCPVDIPRPSVMVLIMDSTQPGRLMFSEPVKEVAATARVAMVPVARKQGADGRASVSYRTSDADALAGTHYTHTEGVLVFEAGEKEKDVAVPVLCGEVDSHFRLALFDATHADLNAKRAVCDVYFVADKKFGIVMRMVQSIMRRQDTQRAANPWLDQFREAVIPGGAHGADEGEDGLQSATRLSTFDYILHCVSISWKVLFATVPPAEYYGGMPCFVVSIMYIAAVTYVVGEFAALFGCAVGLPDAVTAISFVALGTSLPDTFASRQAALDSPDADAAIGNVTGSNSVNVFLGLGLPWLLQSLYWKQKGLPFIAPAGAVSFSVTVYMCCSLVCICLLCLKRVVNGGELGGAGFMRRGVAAVLFSLWLLYLALSGLQAMGHIESF